MGFAPSVPSTEVGPRPGRVRTIDGSQRWPVKICQRARLEAAARGHDRNWTRARFLYTTLMNFCGDAPVLQPQSRRSRSVAVVPTAQRQDEAESVLFANSVGHREQRRCVSRVSRLSPSTCRAGAPALGSSIVVALPTAVDGNIVDEGEAARWTTSS
ncbi:hypothetical protein AMAG_19635 [Allomyces macrogynus ATCC 38327]|uniref:Uncharacterized protein n=1 Tax=Allomyces macrogynus (strain ATCC 38327) TaxID=578462 RepID=A0A0L0SYT6_ALLM3|nr:hypothetical protein AMAG_19635 [Allomyces macrogynus ATCC 38327]|eukprot:KNE67560.1 hypothetical protein AMAG_19635 [Allomyces macrogynus ATCC 38327]